VAARGAWAHSGVSPDQSRGARRGRVWRGGGRSFRSGWLRRRHSETGLLCASAIQNSRMLVSVSRCNGSSVILIARSQFRRLFPWVHLSHGATSTRFSMRVRPVGLGFPRSPQRKLLRAANVGGWPPAQSPVQSRVKRTGAIPARRQSERYGAYLSRRSLSLCWPLNQHPALLGREDCTLEPWYPSLLRTSHGRGV
jgi:hypothetical protein